MNRDHEILALSDSIMGSLKREINDNGYKPSLVIITASDDEASKIYVRNKIKKAEQVGIEVHHFDLDIETRTTEDICNLINSLDKLGYNAIMVQLPLADKFDEKTIIESIPYDKDVDGLTSRQRIMLEDNNDETLVPCTALACYLLIAFKYLKFFGIDSYNLFNIDLSGVEILIINRSKLIGIPLSKLLRNKNATVTVAHSKTNIDINEYLINKRQPFIVTGIGKNIIKCDCFSDYRTIIDCGISRVNGKIKRDVIIEGEPNFDYYGKVGVLTTTMLMYNVLKTYKSQNNFD